MDDPIALLGAMPAAQRDHVLTRMSPRERRRLAALIADRGQFAQYRHDPVGFVTEYLGETVWSRQREILESIRDHKRTAVPACHAPGKSHIAARAAAWWVAVHDPGTALVATTATTFRQVRNILWPHIRRLARRHNLPGADTMNMVEWQVDGEIAAYGFAAHDHDESSVQGIHAPHLMVIIDEAGGIGHQLGQAVEALMTGDHTRLLLLGNPATENENSWFERTCNSDLYNVLRISAYDTPNFTGEPTGQCMACPPSAPPHEVATHLVDQQWVDDVLKEYGEDSAFAQARVFARFPRNSAQRVIPMDWIDAAAGNAEPEPSEIIRLGVDVAADGGDEFVVAKVDGWRVSLPHISRGEVNQNAVDVAGFVLTQILEASAEHERRGVPDPVRVKIDTIGVGWGVVSTLQKWGQEGRHRGVIVPVNVGERPSDTAKYANQRAELWWNGRTVFAPTMEGTSRISLPDDHRLASQLAGPLFQSDSSGRVTIERKSVMKRRGVSSPDRAEAVLLALFEPPSKVSVVPVSLGGMTQSNDWRF